MSGPPEAFLLAMKFLDKHILGMGCMYKHIEHVLKTHSCTLEHIYSFFLEHILINIYLSTISPWIVIIPNKKMGVETDKESSTNRAKRGPN